MSYQDIVVDDSGGIRTITLNRPEAGNKLRDGTCVELSHALQRFRIEPSLSPSRSSPRSTASRSAAAMCCTTSAT